MEQRLFLKRRLRKLARTSLVERSLIVILPEPFNYKCIHSSAPILEVSRLPLCETGGRKPACLQQGNMMFYDARPERERRERRRQEGGTKGRTKGRTKEK